MTTVGVLFFRDHDAVDPYIYIYTHIEIVLLVSI